MLTDSTTTCIFPSKKYTWLSFPLNTANLTLLSSIPFTVTTAKTEERQKVRSKRAKGVEVNFLRFTIQPINILFPIQVSQHSWLQFQSLSTATTIYPPLIKKQIEEETSTRWLNTEEDFAENKLEQPPVTLAHADNNPIFHTFSPIT